jgi:hypothetical protein
MSMEKTGDISSETPQPENADSKAAADSGPKEAPRTEAEADQLQDGPMSRASDAVSDASKK